MGDFDSDDDDDLFAGPTFSNARRERAGQKSRDKGLAFLDESLEDEKKRQAHSVKISQEQYEGDEERLAQAESLANESTKTSSKKRKATLDAINGVDEGLAGLAGSDELVTALDTSQTKMLGTRATLGRGDARSQWLSRKDAIDELSVVLTRFASNKDFTNNRFKKDIISILRTAIKDDTLVLILSYGKLVSICRKHNVAHLPYELNEWLYCLACKPVHGEHGELSTAAFQAQLSLWTLTQGTPARPVIALADMVRDMTAWFAMSLDGVEGKENKDQSDEPSLSRVDVTGLEHFLLLWETALLNDMVSVGDANEATETASRCIITLAVAGLDPCFHRFESLEEALQRVICAFLAFVERNVVPDGDSVNGWIESTAIAMLNECRQYGPGSTDRQDNEDPELGLRLSLMVRTVSMFERRVPVDKIHQKLRTLMAIRALQIIFDVNDWDQHLQSVLSGHGETKLAERASSSFRWRALASSVVGFLTIQSLGDTVLRDGQRCLATVENLCWCALAGLNIVDCTDPQEDDSRGFFGGEEDAKVVLQVVELLESQGRQVGTQASRFSTDRLFSRTEHFLSLMRGYYDAIKTAGRDPAGQAGPIVCVQKRIDQMFAFGPASDDDEEEEGKE